MKLLLAKVKIASGRIGIFVSEFKLIPAWPLKRIISRSSMKSVPASYNVYLLLDPEIILLGDHAELSLNSDYSYQYIK